VTGILAAFAQQAGLVISGIVLARWLGPADRGLVALVTLVPVIVWQFGSLGLPLSVTYAVARDPRTLLPVARMINRAVLVQVLVLVPLNVAITALLVLGQGQDAFLAALVAAGVIPGYLVYQYMLAILQGLQRFGRFYALRVLPIALWAAALLAYVLGGALDLITATISFTASAVGSAVVAFALVRTELQQVAELEVHDPPTSGWMMRFGVRGIFGSASLVNSYRLDQALVGIFLAPATLGIYVVAVSLTNLPRFIAQSLGSMAYPATAGQLDPRAARKTLWRYFWFSALVCTALVGALWIASPWLVPVLFGEEFRGAVAIVQILLVSSLLVSFQRVLVDGARGIGLPGLGSASEIALLVTLLPAAAVLIPASGAVGVAWAFVIASVAGLATVLFGLLVKAGRDGRRAVAGELGSELSPP